VPREEEKKIKPTRSRLNERARESRLQRFVLLAGTIVIVSVVSVVGTGYYITQYRPLHQLACKVNEKESDIAYYVSGYKYYGTSQDITKIVEQNELVRQAAEKLGFSVSDDEAKAEITKRKLPVTDTNITFIKTELLANKLLDEYFENKVPISTLQRETMAMFLESEKQANDIKDRLAKGEDFGKLAAQYSLDKTIKDASGYLDWHPYGSLVTVAASAVLDDYVFNATIGVVSGPVADPTKTKNTGYWIAKLAGRQESQIHIMAILATNEEVAKSVVARLQAGEDFATVAKEISQLPGVKDDGGDLGLISKGDRGGIFDSFAFNPDTKEGDLSQILRDDQVQTKGGYWLVKVLAEDKDKIMSQQDRNTEKNKAYYDWVASLWADPNNKVESVITDEMTQWAMNASKTS